MTKRGIDIDILLHLAENPETGDTVEGIAEWWLVGQEIRFQFHEIEAALDELVSGGLLLKRDIIDSRAIYCLNRNKLEEIRAILG